MFSYLFKRLGIAVMILIVMFQVSNGQYQFVRCLYNPVLPANPSGGWDGRHALEPSVLYRNGQYHMWYTGWGGYGQHSIGYARSDDGIEWTRYQGNPVLTGAIAPWTLGGVRNSTVTWINEHYYMMFQMYPSESGPQIRIGLATSTDGIVWEGYPDPILEAGESGEWDSGRIGYCSQIVEWQGRYWIWFAGRGPDWWHIGVATSSDLINWAKYPDNPVLLQGEAGEWDCGAICHPEVFVKGGKLEMWYVGWPTTSLQNSGVGLAYSEDGVNWVKSAENPIFGPGHYGAWDDRFVGAPTLVFEDRLVKMWYSAKGYSSPWCDQWNIGLAESSLQTSIPPVQNMESLPATQSLRIVGPNPFKESIGFEVLAPTANSSRIYIYNILGQKIKELEIPGSQGTPNQIFWDGRDRYGTDVSNGVYFVCMVSGNVVLTKKMIKMK